MTVRLDRNSPEAGAYWDPKVNAHVVAVQPGGQAVTRRCDLTLSTLLGSCVAACICDPGARVGGLNHFLLPDAAGTASPGSYGTRYGAYAMEVLINEILKHGGRRDLLQAKIFGGARVITLSSAQTVGERNHIFATEFLRREGIPTTALDVGGNRARRVYFQPTENRVLVQTLGNREASRIREDETRLSRAARSAPVSGGVELF
jgi:chemotaxis protein CheD